MLKIIIAGPQGSGKTVLANELSKGVRNCAIYDDLWNMPDLESFLQKEKMEYSDKKFNQIICCIEMFRKIERTEFPNCLVYNL